jgi:hypothetical protein
MEILPATCNGEENEVKKMLSKCMEISFHVVHSQQEQKGLSIGSFCF